MAGPRHQNTTDPLKRKDNWHAIDFEDVAISPQALEAIKSAARKILPHFVPTTVMTKLTLADSISLLSRNIYWEEGSGNLLLCSNLGDKHYCMDIPAEHWHFLENHAVN